MPRPLPETQFLVLAAVVVETEDAYQQQLTRRVNLNGFIMNARSLGAHLRLLVNKGLVAPRQTKRLTPDGRIRTVVIYDLTVKGRTEYDRHQRFYAEQST